MKRLHSLLIALALLAAAAARPIPPIQYSSAHDEPGAAPMLAGLPPVWPHKARPALWAVHGSKGTVYLFGSIHLLPSGVNWLEGSIAKAFDASDAVELEVANPYTVTREDLDRLSAAPDGKPLSTKLDPDTLARLKIAAGPGFADQVIQPWYAALVVSLFELFKLSLNPDEGVEKTLTVRAAVTHKPVGGIETAQEQFGLFTRMSGSRQVTFLQEALAETGDAKREMQTMLGDWAYGDTDALAATLNKGMETDPDLKKLLLTDRNAKFARWVRARLDQPGTVFMAVGAGHLAGPGSVQADLAAMGVKAERLQ